MRFELKLFLVFAIFFSTSVAWVWYLDQRAEHKLVEKLEANLNEIVRTVHLSSQKLSTAQSTDREVLENFIQELKSQKGVREVSVVGSSQEVIASSNPKKLGQKKELTGQEMVVREEFGVRDSTGHYVRYEVRVPLLREGRVIGLVQATIFLDDFRYFLRQIHLKNLIVTIAALLFAFGAAFFVLRRLNRPLRELTGAAQRVAAGDFGVQLKTGGEDELGRLTNAFNAMAQKLSEQRQSEDRLHELERRAILAETASSLAHEIRNPLNLINLTADHLAHQFRPQKQGQEQPYLELIAGLKAQVAHLNKMVNDFLTVGRPAKLKKSAFSLRELSDQVQLLVKRQLSAKKLEWRAAGDWDVAVNADLEQLRLVLLNLVLNAIEAAPAKSAIWVEAHPKTPRELLLSVRDNGAGIPAEDLEKVFEPYFSKRPGGTGLGLALAKRIVEEHGGKIAAANHPQGGAQIEISLPLEG